MTLHLTYCAADKHSSPEKIPALARYRSKRIRAVYAHAELCGEEFRILSGKFGLLAADENIPWYDHLLEDSEIDSHAQLIATQLNDLKPDLIEFHTRGTDVDPNLGAYHHCVQLACEELKIPLQFRHYSDEV